MARPAPYGRWLAFAVGGAAGVGTAALRAAGAMEGPVALAAAVLALVLVPTSREFGRRVFLNGTIVLGWVALLWWVALPFDRVGVVLALGVTVGAYFAAEHVRSRVSFGRIAGRARMVDLVPLAAGGLSVAALWIWLTPKNGQSALSVLMPGWDNSAHFNMFRMIWTHGRTIDGVPAPVPDQWAFFHYPQGYHATLVSVADLLWPAAGQDLGASLMAFSRATALLVAALVALLVAGICALPSTRRRPEVAAPIAAVVTAAMVLGVGRELFAAGFASFLVACLQAGAAVIVVVLAPRVASPVYVVALGGAIVAVAHSWLLLLIVLLPVCAALMVPFRRFSWRAPRSAWLSSLAVVAVTGAAVLRAYAIIMSNGFTAEELEASGGITPPSAGLSVLVLLGTLGVCLATVPIIASRGRTGRVLAWKLGVLAGSPPVAAMVLVYLARLQIGAHGAVSYYFWKLLTGAVLVALCVIAAAAASVFRARPEPSTRLARGGLLAGSAVVALALTQAFGYTGPAAPNEGFDPSDRASDSLKFVDWAIDTQRPMAARMYAAVAVDVADAFDAAYLQDPETGQIHPSNAQQWFMSLHESWTPRGNSEAGELAQGQTDLAGAVRVGEAWLHAHPTGQLVVPPELRAAMASSPGAERVLSWG